MKNKYMFVCNHCGFNLELDTKEQWNSTKKYHKKHGCILADAQYKNPVYARPEALEWVKGELAGRKND